MYIVCSVCALTVADKESPCTWSLYIGQCSSYRHGSLLCTCPLYITIDAMAGVGIHNEFSSTFKC